jgi:hypothetical protein
MTTWENAGWNTGQPRDEVHGSQTFGAWLSMLVESPKSGNSDFPQFGDG